LTSKGRADAGAARDVPAGKDQLSKKERKGISKRREREPTKAEGKVEEADAGNTGAKLAESAEIKLQPNDSSSAVGHAAGEKKETGV